jgi:tetratricopeptide (TPR) repeat protein
MLGKFRRLFARATARAAVPSVPTVLPVPAVPEAAVTPDRAASHANSAHAYMQRAAACIANRQWKRALYFGTRAAALEPADAAIHVFRGNVLRQLRRMGDALAAYDEALKIQPELADAHYNRGVVLQEVGRNSEALASYAAAISRRPAFPEAHYNLGNLLRVLKRSRDALASYDAAIAAREGYAEALANRGVVLQELGEWDAALASYDAAIAARSDYAHAHFNRATLHDARHDGKAAIAGYERAIALRADYAEAHYNRALALLRDGMYAQGFRDLEWRWRYASALGLPDRSRYRRPDWNGDESPLGRRILVFSEQGIGDTLQFCRFLPLLARRGAEVIFEVPPTLTGLFREFAGVSRLLGLGTPLPDFDLQCSVMSLPHLLQVNDVMPVPVPYLRSEPAISAAWKQRLGPKQRPRVGLVWSGGFRGDHPQYLAANARRNIALAKLAPLATASIEFHSLQKGDEAEAELARARTAGWTGPAMAAHAHLLTDFAETAGLIDSLDLVISVDTSTAHLAAAMGKRVWLLNRYDSCWRWQSGREDSPWYPTLRIYRQRSPDDWDDVVRRVCADLHASWSAPGWGNSATT